MVSDLHFAKFVETSDKHICAQLGLDRSEPDWNEGQRFSVYVNITLPSDHPTLDDINKVLSDGIVRLRQLETCACRPGTSCDKHRQAA